MNLIHFLDVRCFKRFLWKLYTKDKKRRTRNSPFTFVVPMTPNCPWMWFCTESTSIFIARDGERSKRIWIISLLDAILQLEFKFLIGAYSLQFNYVICGKSACEWVFFFLSFVCIYLCVLEMHFNHKNLIWFLCVFVCGLVVVAVVCVVCLLINFFVLFYYFISLIHFLRHTISDCSRFSSLSLFFFSVSLRFSFSLSLS